MKHKGTETINIPFQITTKGEQMKKKFFTKKRKISNSLFLVFILSLTMGMNTFASQTDTPFERNVEASTNTVQSAVYTGSDQILKPVIMSARSASGYAAAYTDYNIASFYVNVTGSSASRGVLNLKAWDFPSGTDVYVDVYRPDGSLALSDVKLPIGQEITKTISNFPIGQYRVRHFVSGVGKGWIYCRANNG